MLSNENAWVIYSNSYPTDILEKSAERLSRNLDQKLAAKCLFCQKTLTKTPLSVKQASFVGAVMKKTAVALILTLVLFSTVFISQTHSLASANPDWRPWEYEISYPTIDVMSPVAGVSYPSNDVWLNFTLTKPSDWLNKTDCYISYVTYCVDGSASGPYGQISDNSDENETIIEVQDPRGVVNSPTSFSFSFNLEGLTDGVHTLEILVEGNYEFAGFGYTFPRTSFTVYTPSAEPTATPGTMSQPESFPTTLITASVVLVAVIGIGLVIYFRKRNYQNELL